MDYIQIEDSRTEKEKLLDELNLLQKMKEGTTRRIKELESKISEL